MTEAEKLAILGGEDLHIDTIRIKGSYANGAPYEREYKVNINMRQGDNFHFNLKTTYDDPMHAAMNPKAL